MTPRTATPFRAQPSSELHQARTHAAREQLAALQRDGVGGIVGQIVMWAVAMFLGFCVVVQL